MNSILKKILNAAKDVAITSVTTTIPGASIVISGVEKLVDKDKTNNYEGIIEINTGVIAALESLKGQEVADEVLLSQGISQAKQAFETIKKALNK